MAVDKLVDSTQLDTDLTSVANAIRTKGGTSASLAFPAGFVSAVEALPIQDNDYAKMYQLGRHAGRVESDYAFQIPNNFSINLPWTSMLLHKATTSTSNANAGVQAFRNAALTTAVLLKPSVLGQEFFLSCTKLVAVDLGTSCYRLYHTCFSGCSKMNKLVLRRNAVVELGNISVFVNSPFASGKAGGTLYVPQAQISSYQSATNWSTILGYSTNSIQAIEGSIYETQYVDGTPIA